MWRNAEFRDFVERLRVVNLARPPGERVGVYGMDVYDVYDAADAVVAYLQREDPAAAGRAQAQYRCFAPYRRSMDRYALAVRRKRSCQSAAEAVVAELPRLPPPGPEEREARFAAVRAAATVAGGEEYYRVMQTTGYSWNARDRRMASAVSDIRNHVSRQGAGSRVVVWAHNSHVGDARETSARLRGEINLGQLMRERGSAYLVGFLTDHGRVFAAPEWDAPGRVFNVRPALPTSHEAQLARAGAGRQVVLTQSRQPSGHRPQRAIGVVYLPAREKEAHYFEARLERQFDAVVFVPETSPITPLPGAGRGSQARVAAAAD